MLTFCLFRVNIYRHSRFRSFLNSRLERFSISSELGQAICAAGKRKTHSHQFGVNALELNGRCRVLEESRFLLLDAEAMDGDFAERFARLQQRRGERIAVRGVGIVLRLETKSLVTTVSIGAFVARQVIRCVELHAGLSGFDFKNATRFRIDHAGRRSQGTDLTTNHIAVIVSIGGDELIETICRRGSRCGNQALYLRHHSTCRSESSRRPHPGTDQR